MRHGDKRRVQSLQENCAANQAASYLHYGTLWQLLLKTNMHTLDFQVLVMIVENRRPPLPKPFLAYAPSPSFRFWLILSLSDSRGGCLCGMCSFSRDLQEAPDKRAASMWSKNAWQIKHGTSSARSPSSSNHGCTQGFQNVKPDLFLFWKKSKTWLKFGGLSSLI